MHVCRLIVVVHFYGYIKQHVSLLYSTGLESRTLPYFLIWSWTTYSILDNKTTIVLYAGVEHPLLTLTYVLLVILLANYSSPNFPIEVLSICACATPMISTGD